MEHVVKLLPLGPLADQLVLHFFESIHELLLALIDIVFDALKYILVTMLINGFRASIFLLFNEFFTGSDVIKLLVGLTRVQRFHPSCCLSLFGCESTFLLLLLLVL